MMGYEQCLVQDGDGECRNKSALICGLEQPQAVRRAPAHASRCAKVCVLSCCA